MRTEQKLSCAGDDGTTNKISEVAIIRCLNRDAHQVRAHESSRPYASRVGAIAERAIRRIDEALPAIVHQNAEAHPVHRVAEAQAAFGIGESERAAGADVSEGGLADQQ